MSADERARRFRGRRSGRPDGSRSGRHRIGGPFVLGIAALGAALLAFMVVRFSVADALLESGPEAAALVAPDHPRIRLDRALDELQLTGNPEAATEQAALDAFRRAPLSEVPLMIGARRASQRGDEAKADRLILAAARRNPRSRYIRLAELEYHVRNGRIEEAAASMAVLTRFFSEAGSFLVAELGRMAADPAARPAVRRVMETDPQIRASLLEQLAQGDADPAMILDLAGTPPPRPDVAAPRWQRLLLERMVERGQVEGAFQVWARLAGIDPGAGRGVYDPDFAGLPGPPPFNWSFVSGSDGFAERSRSGGGVQAQYYGRRDARLASQLIRLAPGSYRLGFEAEGEASGEHGRLSWVVECHPGRTRLAEVPIGGVSYSRKRFAAAFTVPASGCPGQWLRLVGESAEFPRDQQVTIRNLRIEESQRP